MLREPKEIASVSINSLSQLNLIFIANCSQNFQHLSVTQNTNIRSTILWFIIVQQARMYYKS